MKESEFLELLCFLFLFDFLDVFLTKMYSPLFLLLFLRFLGALLELPPPTVKGLTKVEDPPTDPKALKNPEPLLLFGLNSDL